MKDRSFRPLPVRERMIPKAGGKLRRLGIATITDRVVQASLKLVLEPVFEADFLPCSYGFRPNRRAHDAVAEIRLLTSRSYEWIVEGDIKACFDEISHSALLERVRARIGDKRVLALVKAFLKAGILGEDRVLRDNHAGTPQGSILSPLLSNVALSALDEHIARAPGGPAASRSERSKRRRHGLPNYRLIRYADDWCLVVSGTRADAEALREEIAGVLSPMGLRLSEEKTLITCIDEGLDFLGWRIQRRRKPGTSRYYVYTYPSRKAVKAVTGKVRALCRGTGTEPAARCPAAPAQPGAAGLVRLFQARRVQRRLRIPAPVRLAAGPPVAAPQTPPEHLERHPPPLLRRRMVASQRRPGTVQPSRSAHHALPLPGNSRSPRHGRSRDNDHHAPARRDLRSARCGESRTAGAGGGPGKPTGGNTGRAPRADLTTLCWPSSASR